MVDVEEICSVGKPACCLRLQYAIEKGWSARCHDAQKQWTTCYREVWRCEHVEVKVRLGERAVGALG
jgi:hypothetical protein